MAPISLTHAGKYKYPECVVQSNISENRHHLNDTTLKIINPTGEIWKKNIKFIISNSVQITSTRLITDMK